MPYVAPTKWVEVPAAVRAALADPFTKRAEADGVPGLTHLADVAGWRAGDINANWGGPRPVTSLLIGAGLGSLGGYGLGRLAETILPKKYFDEGALRKRGLILGGLAGALPAAWQASHNVRNTGDWTSVFDRWPQEPAEKAGIDLFAPVINRDQFNQDVMGFEETPLRVRAATAGLVEAASAVAGSSFITPWDVAKVAVGAGTGLVSGVIAGKALGFLAGLSPAGQEGVMRIGLWTGILNSVVPKALGLR
jgi:hypothetical protein